MLCAGSDAIVSHLDIKTGGGTCVERKVQERYRCRNVKRLLTGFGEDVDLTIPSAQCLLAHSIWDVQAASSSVFSPHQTVFDAVIVKNVHRDRQTASV